jgi:hypothetical protein
MKEFAPNRNDTLLIESCALPPLMPKFAIPESVRLLRLLAPLLALSITASMVVSAAPITWNAPVAVGTGAGNSSDVSTNGTLVEAYNAAITSYTGGNKTVNGVTFIATTNLLPSNATTVNDF